MPESPVLFTSIETKTQRGCYGYLLQSPTYTIPVQYCCSHAWVHIDTGLCLYSPLSGLVNKW